MKCKSIKKFIIGLLIFGLTGCILSCDQMKEELHDSEGARQVMEQEQEPLPKGVLVPEESLYTLEEIDQLESKQITWGPGSVLDGQGRPEACVMLQEQYGSYSAWFLGPDAKKVYLTFDEGYENGYTAQVLDVLKRKNVTATFFVTMDYVIREPGLVQRMIDEGHTVGNHTTHHPNMTQISLEDAKKEVMELHEHVRSEFGYEMTLFRAPEGAISEQTMALLQSMGYDNVLWSFAYHDWDVNQQMSCETALKKATKQLHPGAIYLFHAVSRTNAEILGDWIDTARAQGYEFGNWEVLW